MITIQNASLSCYSTRLQGSIRCYNRLSRSIRYCCSDFIIIVIQDNGRSRLSTGHCYRRLGVGFLQQACLYSRRCETLHRHGHIIRSIVLIGNGHHTCCWDRVFLEVFWSCNIRISSLKSFPNLLFFRLGQVSGIIDKRRCRHIRNRITDAIILRQNLNA